MANKQQITQRKQELVTQLAVARKSITLGKKELKEKLQIKNLLRKVISEKPKSLFAGSAVAGLGAALFLRRPRKIKKSPQSMKLILFGWALSLMKPTAKAWLVARAKEAAAQPSATRSSRMPPQ